MLIVHTRNEVIQQIELQRNSGKTIGFVPTMGALHQGHLELVKQALNHCDFVVVSIFVNPTQFNNPNDLKNYPRTLQSDCSLLEGVGCNLVFAPQTSEMYPENDTRVFDFEGLDNIMEGAHRPGHFNGVAQIVSKLFELVSPDQAFFGRKDFQQLAIIRKMTKKLQFKLEIVACDTIREADGLAMSSRNRLLTQQNREAAPGIYRTLVTLNEKIRTMSPVECIKYVEKQMENSSPLRLEYFEIVEEETLIPAKSFVSGRSYVGCIAVWAGDVRLIDNIKFNF